ncbi:hypothetical protein BB561_003163 [Smittium simulii]|uniref:2-oxoisovalerate dehydrogenase subunit alpha n=1 Tax=Smittium simulii TaxID=133385 RepID=A0A2T9YMP7_9FUNG|nr:hypothetical protein BB561_003163 [Smittium simulii]
MVVSKQRYSTGLYKKAENRPNTINKLEFVSVKERIPMYSVMDIDGNIIDSSNKPDVPKELIQSTYKNILTINFMDQILYEAQRQGRISFYMTSFGEEAVVGSSLALDKNDVVYSQVSGFF